MGLRVTVESPTMTADYLDVKLNINNFSYMPHKKQNAKIMCINKFSSHPKNIIKQILNIFNQCLNKRLSNAENFLNTKQKYELIMKKCCYNNKLYFETKRQKIKTNNKNKRKITIIWYNPQFSSSVVTYMANHLLS